MRVLLTESKPGAGGEAEKQLRQAGFDISFCHPDHRADTDGCVVLRGIGHCPLRTDADIALVVDARAEDAPTLPTAREFGASCAVRNHLPLVVAGQADTERFPWSEAVAVCSPEELAGLCEHLARPVDDAISRDAQRVAETALRANGYDPDVTVTIAHAAGSTAVFLHIQGLSDGIARAETAGLVREAVSGRKDLDGTVSVVVIPEDRGK